MSNDHPGKEGSREGLTRAEALRALLVLALLSSAMPGWVYAHASNHRLVELTHPESLVATGDWGNRTLQWAPPEEVIEVVTRMQHLPGDEGLPYEALQMEMEPKMPPFISAEKAAEDVERLFYLLENGYSGYGYFSNVGSFEEAEEGILRGLKLQPVWNAEELSSLIHEHLGFLRDRHLDIGGKKYGGHLDFWYDEGFEIREEDGEYLFASDGAEYTVVSVNGESPEDYLFPSLNADGEAILRLGQLSHSQPQPLELKARGGQGTRRWRVKLQRSEPRYSWIYEEKEVGGVPVVRIRSFGDHPKEYIDAFLASASRYKGAPCLIVDIRGNGGGNEAWPKQWVTRFTGRQPDRVQVFSELISETTMIGRSNSYALALHNVPELGQQGYPAKVEEFRGYAEAHEEEGIAPFWWPYTVPEPRTIPSPTTLIALVDGYVYSSGEGFISYLHQVENVVIVGENSGGAVTYGQMSHHRLPNSQILVALPTSLNVFVDLEYREEKGFLPDLWVPAGDVLNYAVAAVRRGTIPTSQSYREEISGAVFTPEEPSVRDRVLTLLPIITAVLYGVVFVYLNRKRGRIFFILAGVVLAAIGYFFLSREPPLGYVCILLGAENLLISLYKWRKARETPEIA